MQPARVAGHASDGNIVKQQNTSMVSVTFYVDNQTQENRGCRFLQNKLTSVAHTAR
jgi:hypothetical protein